MRIHREVRAGRADSVPGYIAQVLADHKQRESLGALLRDLIKQHGEPAAEEIRSAERAPLFLRSAEVEIIPLDEQLVRACGELCGAANSADVIDAPLVILGRDRRDPAPAAHGYIRSLESRSD